MSLSSRILLYCFEIRFLFLHHLIPFYPKISWALEAALDPVIYLASPVISAVKFGMMVNKTSEMQPLAKMIESTYADPYDIHKKLFEYRL